MKILICFFVRQDNSYASFRKLFQFSDNSVAELANDGIFYRKEFHRPLEARAIESYNLVRLYTEWDRKTGSVIQIQEADLVFVSRQFNITAVFDGDKVGLCVQRVPDSIFVLRFTDREQALRVFATLVEDADNRIPCLLDQNWIDENIKYIDSPTPFRLPHLP